MVLFNKSIQTKAVTEFQKIPVVTTAMRRPYKILAAQKCSLSYFLTQLANWQFYSFLSDELVVAKAIISTYVAL